MVVDGGVYTSNGEGSPAVYVTADVSIHDAELNATGSEALCMEGLNTVRLYDCDLSGDMEDLPQNDNTWTVIVYQSMSGDSQVGEGALRCPAARCNRAMAACFIRPTPRASLSSAALKLRGGGQRVLPARNRQCQ